MAELKKVLEERIMSHENLEKVFLEGVSLREEEKKYFKLNIKKIESGERYDTHECDMTIKSDKNLYNVVTGRSMIRLMRELEEPWGIHYEEPYFHILKILDKGVIVSNNQKQMDMKFVIINNIERE